MTRTTLEHDASRYDVRRYLGQDWLGATIDPWEDPWFRFGRLMQELDASLEVRSHARWLDVGCHQGQFAKLVGSRYGASSVGADVWSAELKRDPSWEYHQVDLEQGFDIGTDFAFVSALEVIEHMTDTDRFLDDCRRSLIAGGHLVLTTPNINSLRNRIEVPLGQYPTGLEYRNEIHHVRLYNVRALRDHVGSHGFSVEWVRGVSFTPMALLKRMNGASWDRRLANGFPQLCSNIILLARRK